MIQHPLLKSIAGFVTAFTIGALLPRAVGFLVKRIAFRSLPQVLAVAVVGLLAGQLARMLAGPGSARTSHPSE
jgi:hypothetical protein